MTEWWTIASLRSLLTTGAGLGARAPQLARPYIVGAAAAPAGSATSGCSSRAGHLVGHQVHMKRADRGRGIDLVGGRITEPDRLAVGARRGRLDVGIRGLARQELAPPTRASTGRPPAARNRIGPSGVVADRHADGVEVRVGSDGAPLTHLAPWRARISGSAAAAALRSRGWARPSPSLSWTLSVRTTA